jgi:aspartyl protease family protein
MSKALIYVIGFGAFIAFAASGERRSSSAEQTEIPESGTREPVVSHIPRAPNGHFYVHATVNGQLVRFMVDTGASSVALTEEDARRIGESFSKDRYETVGTGASGPGRTEPLTGKEKNEQA